MSCVATSRMICPLIVFTLDVDVFVFFFSSRRRHTRFDCDWSSDVCSSDLQVDVVVPCREPGETADHIHLTQLRHAVDLAAQKLWVHQIAHLLKGHVQRRKIERTAPGRSLLEEQRFVYREMPCGALLLAHEASPWTMRSICSRELISVTQRRRALPSSG